MIDLTKIDKSWTLFLDRDGVINYETVGSYITRWEDFKFYDGVLKALSVFSERFGRIFIVTNQRGVSKRLMTEQDLKNIHLNMLEMIKLNGGRVDEIYYCIDMEAESPCRKPNAGMGLQAKKDFPEIEFKRSLMIGNTINDMIFGKKLGMYTFFISSNRPAPVLPDATTDAVFSSLEDVADLIMQ
ncbi:HAD-IIIA family hydrolase [Agriterribacter sp.]|uniref:D-glycero-alpha-D-manno-heptose-1,7-bisphosphate 7-phosphatase n=1 Tax=Agriterribacter sp. TaxID=2821509 RepID=UPI002CCB4B73|nr:HAD-IIIA family hydrolase [Agriterribacter sp.]HRO45838.1 HAD-IIIA family hydrolase [Agriterribacter sp.]HRQ16220.1 HAD-IIIA family hydrolase [Agriterribacter sp.]